MLATRIRLRTELAKLNHAILKAPKDTLVVRMTMELAEFATEECLITFADSDLYYQGRLVMLDDSLPSFWSV